jgi:putative membrane protein insertion efficiency factor
MYDILPVWRKILNEQVPCFGTSQTVAHHYGIKPMKYSNHRMCLVCAGTVQRMPANAGRALIWVYRHTLSPLVGFNCRHVPTCSLYGDEAIARFGLWAGGWMTLARLLRGQPWGTSGLDLVPESTPPGARWFLPWRFARWRSVNAPQHSRSG